MQKFSRKLLEYDYDMLLKRLREQAFLNAGIRIVFSDKTERSEPRSTKCSTMRAVSASSWNISTSAKRISGMSCTRMSSTFGHGRGTFHRRRVALQYNDSYNTTLLSFANNIHTADGGTHEVGFKNALTKVINEYGKKFGLL